jgi:hypothetical protein
MATGRRSRQGLDKAKHSRIKLTSFVNAVLHVVISGYSFVEKVGNVV